MFLELLSRQEVKDHKDHNPLSPGFLLLSLFNLADFEVEGEFSNPRLHRNAIFKYSTSLQDYPIQTSQKKKHRGIAGMAGNFRTSLLHSFKLNCLGLTGRLVDFKRFVSFNSLSFFGSST